MRPDNAYNRLTQKQKAVNEVLDIEHIDSELLKCLNESTTKRLYQPSEQVPLSTQKEFRTKFVSLHVSNLLTRLLIHSLRNYGRITCPFSHKL